MTNAIKTNSNVYYKNKVVYKNPLILMTYE